VRRQQSKVDTVGVAEGSAQGQWGREEAGEADERSGVFGCPIAADEPMTPSGRPAGDPLRCSRPLAALRPPGRRRPPSLLYSALLCPLRGSVWVCEAGREVAVALPRERWQPVSCSWWKWGGWADLEGDCHLGPTHEWRSCFEVCVWWLAWREMAISVWARFL
jgi:hypothetical protein